jgi:hypothetical protein
MRTTTTPGYRLGDVVGYRGTHTGCHGARYRVEAVVAVCDAPARYNLAWEFAAPGDVILERVRAASLTPAPALRNP